MSDSGMDKLEKVCPFCGSDDIEPLWLEELAVSQFECAHCRARGPWFHSPGQGKKVWNERAAIDALPTYSAEVPTEPGWYWLRSSRNPYGDRPVEVTTTWYNRGEAKPCAPSIFEQDVNSYGVDLIRVRVADIKGQWSRITQPEGE